MKSALEQIDDCFELPLEDRLKGLRFVVQGEQYVVTGFTYYFDKEHKKVHLMHVDTLINSNWHHGAFAKVDIPEVLSNLNEPKPDPAVLEYLSRWGAS